MGAIDKTDHVIARYLGKQEYSDIFQKMKDFTKQRTDDTIDEIWLLEHPPVFTQGRNGKKEHILDAGDIPVIPIDRGGQITYHGPGQLIVYLLLDIRRKSLGVRKLVTLMETSIISFLAKENITAESKADAPGVYVQEKKIAALGLRISKGCCYHGLSLNVDMDLSAFQRINPCGYQGLEVTQCRDSGFHTTVELAAKDLLANHLAPLLDYSPYHLSWS